LRPLSRFFWYATATAGLTLAGPLLHLWFGFLFRTVPGTGMVQTAKKILMDQLLFAPIFNPLFVGYIYLLEGECLLACWQPVLLPAP
jgi:hypothetical protein